MDSERPVRPGMTLADLNAKNRVTLDMPTRDAGRPITKGDIDSAARGLRMTSKTPSELDEIIKAHSDKDMFASKVIVEAAKQMKAAKLRSGASYDAKDADGKVDKAEVNYSQGKGNDCCRNCVHFQPGVDQDAVGACELVEGPIDPDGWCKLFEAKG